MVTKQRVLAGSVAAKSRRTSQSAPRGPSTATLSPAHCVQAQYSQRDKVSAGRKTGIYLHGTVTTNNAKNALHDVRVRFHIIGNARIKNVYKYQSCMVTKLPIICEQEPWELDCWFPIRNQKGAFLQSCMVSGFLRAYSLCQYHAFNRRDHGPSALQHPVEAGGVDPR